MILQIFTVLFILSIASKGDGASLSNVYVQSEPQVGYYIYGTPYTSIENPRLSQVKSLSPVPGYVAPCVSPCVYPQTVATVTAVDPSPNVVAYKANNVPDSVAPTKQEYEYSYIVHDENTGDHKAQRELSDGSVVQGQYSFLQPDGYIREVQYVADDISGFKAVVKTFLPAAVEGKSNGEEQEKQEPPCQEPKNESLKEGSDSGEIYLNQLKEIYEVLQRKYEETTDKSKETKKIFSEDSSEESEENSEEETKSNKESSESQESEVVSDSEQFRKELKVKSHKKETKESSDESSEEESEELVSNGKNKVVHELLKPIDETHVPYKDVLRCIEAAMKKNYGVSSAVKQGPSPLTYIVLNKPC